MLNFDGQLEGWQSGLMRRTRNAVGGNPSEVQILYPPQNKESGLATTIFCESPEQSEGQPAFARPSVGKVGFYKKL